MAFDSRLGAVLGGHEAAMAETHKWCCAPMGTERDNDGPKQASTVAESIRSWPLEPSTFG